MENIIILALKEFNEQVGAMRNIISHYFDGHNVNIDDDIINNVKEATAVFEKYFERAGVVAIDERTKYAEEIYRKYA